MSTNAFKVEIEITEAEIKAALERKVRAAIADQTNSWSGESYIKARIKELWGEHVDATIRSVLADEPKIRERVAAAVEAKLKAQITALLKSKGGAA